MTAELLENGYVAGYNTPITSDIYQKLGYNETCTDL
jgi:predicted acetyltransferase